MGACVVGLRRVRTVCPYFATIFRCNHEMDCRTAWCPRCRGFLYILVWLKGGEQKVRKSANHFSHTRYIFTIIKQFYSASPLYVFFFFCKSRYLTIGNRNDGRCVPASLCFLPHYFFSIIQHTLQRKNTTSLRSDKRKSCFSLFIQFIRFFFHNGVD